MKKNIIVLFQADQESRSCIKTKVILKIKLLSGRKGTYLQSVFMTLPITHDHKIVPPRSHHCMSAES